MIFVSGIFSHWCYLPRLCDINLWDGALCPRLNESPLMRDNCMKKITISTATRQTTTRPQMTCIHFLPFNRHVKVHWWTGGWIEGYLRIIILSDYSHKACCRGLVITAIIIPWFIPQSYCEIGFVGDKERKAYNDFGDLLNFPCNVHPSLKLTTPAAVAESLNQTISPVYGYSYTIYSRYGYVWLQKPSTLQSRS